MTRSGGREAAVDRMCGAGRIRGVVRQQVRDEARYVFRGAVATQRNSLGKGLVAAANTSSASLNVILPAMGPGQQALTRTLRAPCSSAAVLVRPMMACLDVT